VCYRVHCDYLGAGPKQCLKMNLQDLNPIAELYKKTSKDKETLQDILKVEVAGRSAASEHKSWIVILLAELYIIKPRQSQKALWGYVCCGGGGS